MPVRLPVVVGFGGYNAAGRSSFHQGFRRMVIESLPLAERQQTIAGLAVLMGLITADDSGYRTLAGEPLSLAQIDTEFGQAVLDGTLIRRIGTQYFDVDAAPWQSALSVSAEAEPIRFVTRARQLPETLPEGWSVTALDGGYVRVEAPAAEFKVDNTRVMDVRAAGQLPDGFEPAALYKSRFHPRGLQMTIVAVTDAIRSIGLSWQTIADSVHPDQVAVFSSSVMSQVDNDGFGGMMQSRLKGSRVSAKQLPLGLNTMPADFINAYVLGSVGVTGATTGACATFLYNLSQAVEGIKSGKFRVAVVGSSEAPITTEVIEGFAAMSALATEEGLRALDGTDTVDYRRTSRPFGDNCGFTIGESAQYVVLMDDELALTLGADIHAAVTDVFINADGYKKSISAPGSGNFITMAKAVASARTLVGDEGIRGRSFVHAHGSSTPGNRTTESQIFDVVARAFGIENWPVAAVKAYVGHSIGPASGDQFMAALGSFHTGIIPGIKTIAGVADDVLAERLLISNSDIVRQPGSLDVAFINSKGFGGNNATGVMLAPHVVSAMLARRYDAAAITAWQTRREAVRQQAESYNQQALRGQLDVIYHFGEDMIDEDQIRIDGEKVQIPGFSQMVEFELQSPYADML